AKPENGMSSGVRPKSEPPSFARGRAEELLKERSLKQLADSKDDEDATKDSFSLAFALGGETPVVDDQTLVVWCELSPDGQSEESFSRLLAQQNIAWQPTNADAQVAEEATGRSGRSTSLEAFAYRDEAEGASTRSVDPAQLADALKRRGLQQARKDQKLPAIDALQNPRSQMIFVEATDSQVEAVLEAMDQDRDTYRTVDVEPAPESPRQQDLAHYSRAAPNRKNEQAEPIGRLSIQNRAADQRLPQGRAMRLRLQMGGQAAAAKTGKPAAPPPPAPAAESPQLETAELKSSLAHEPDAEPVSRVLFVLVPPAEAAAKPAAEAKPQP
ncbi:MAG: hypothetical protein ACREJM_02620, partial [Candidatus Saccharimonadales bacterium]